MATLKDVARLSGVSITTVSRVINGSNLVKPETVKNVKKAMDLLDFSPNFMATALRSNSTHLIGLVIPSSKHYYFSNFVHFTSSYCFEKGYGLIIGNHEDNPTKEEALIKEMLHRNVDGLILSMVSDESRAFGQLADKQIPTVIFDRETQDSFSQCVLLDNYKAGWLAGNYFSKLGHKKIACITGPLAIKQCRDRLAGFCDALEQYGITLKRNFQEEGKLDFISGYECARKIFSSEESKPTAIWAQDDLMAAGAMQLLLTSGYKVPDDVSIIGLDDLELSSMLTPKLTTISQPIEEMSVFAVDTVINARYGKNQQIAVRRIFEPKLIERETTKSI